MLPIGPRLRRREGFAMCVIYLGQYYYPAAPRPIWDKTNENNIHPKVSDRFEQNHQILPFS
jgi:hypothetical protein